MASLRCCAMQFRKWRGSVRIITVFVFLAIFAYDANWNVLTFSRNAGVPTPPWVYPAVFSDRYLMMCICMAVMRRPLPGPASALSDPPVWPEVLGPGHR